MFDFFKKMNRDERLLDNIISNEQLLQTNIPRAKEIEDMLKKGTAKKIPKTDESGRVIGEEIIDQNGQILSFLNLEEMERLQKIKTEGLEKAREKDEHDRRLIIN